MDTSVSKYDISPREWARGRNLRIAAWSAPVILSLFPAILFLALFFLFGSTPPIAATFLFLGIIATLIGFVIGLGLAAFFSYRRSTWTKEMRERIAADGIRAEEVEWFRNELKSSEKRVLASIERLDPLLADAYRETLASRLTASRIIRSSRRELQLTQQRQARLRNLKVENAARFLEEVQKDESKLRSIADEAKLMLSEAESRLQMIEAAAMRGSSITDSQLALQKLSARSKELPLALEEARMTEEIRAELEREELVKE